MSNFTCEKCGAAIIDSSRGYVTGCSHYPPDVKPRKLSEFISGLCLIVGDGVVVLKHNNTNYRVNCEKLAKIAKNRRK